MTINDWLSNPNIDNNTKDELNSLKNAEEIADRFNGLLEFGTGGLRGIIGAGTKRMNVYTVRHATQSLANLINEQNPTNPTVVIAHDSRNFSREFSMEAAKVLISNDIKVYIFDELRPTPQLSFAVTDLGCIAGINVTASHNPAEYNGYKVYWSDGAQLSPEQAEKVASYMKAIDVTDVSVKCFDDISRYLTILDKNYDEKYIEKVLEQVINPDVIKRQSDIKIVYTPFHGAGYRLVPQVLSRAGFKNIITVPSQMEINGNFPTVKSPNPENPEGFALAIDLAKEHDAKIIIGTDPDADRMGLLVRTSEESDDYEIISGNQIGVLMLDYILKSRVEQGKLPKNAAAIKTIVTTELATNVCHKYGVNIINVLTGFKFIGEKMNEFKRTGEFSFIFGFEESYGYLAGDYCHDKDSVFASLLISEAAAYYADKSMTLKNALESLFKEFGYYNETTINIEMKGFGSLERMKKTMDYLRNSPLEELCGLKVVAFKDYLGGIEGLPPSNVLHYTFSDGSVLVVRPSGTEPKIKLYALVSEKTPEKAAEKSNKLGIEFKNIAEKA